MPRIVQLPISVITKIAAGEVIERPASVVKELLENSVDAGAGRIDVDIEEGGAELIRVVDDGGGIHQADLELAFANHATSKLHDADDLFRVASLGFRGEALASIGGVAQVTLQSRPREAEVGAEVSCQGGTLSPVRVWNGAPGTRVEVRRLFFNTPVRRKFLRSPGTEVGHISEQLTRLAFARPGLHLTLSHNSKKVYEVPAGASLIDRIGLFCGDEVKQQLYAVDASLGPARLYGFIADPACDRNNARMQYLFLNGRWIRDRSLSHAVQEAYRGLLMGGRYAVTFLFVELPPDLVDVNVHPTKAEVRFRDGQALFSLVLSTIRDRLNRESLTPRLRSPYAAGAPTGRPLGVPSGFLQPAPSREMPSLFAQPGLPAFRRPETNGAQEVVPTPRDEQRESRGSAEIAPKPPLTLPSPPGGRGQGEGDEPRESWGPEAPIKAIQLHNAYLVLETPEGMLVIDQHALHERILFEQFKERFRTGAVEIQKLLVPEPVTLTAEQAARTLEQRSALMELGLGVEDFGGGTVLLSCYPALLGKQPPAELLKFVVDHLMAKDRLPTREQLLEDLMSLMACHTAVRSGDPLTAEEIAALAALRHLAHDAHHCPHGRPTALLFTRQDLDRQFRRT